MFIPSQQRDPSGLDQSTLVDHVNVAQMNPGQTNKFGAHSQQQMMQPQNKISMPSSLNIRSAEFQFPQTGQQVASGEQPQQININSKEFMPSKQQDTIHSKKQVNQNQIADLLDFRQQIKDKIQTAINNNTKIRFEDLLDDTTIKLDSEYVEDQMRIICNNTGKSNFKDKVEDLKKFVVQKPPQIDKDGNEVIDKKSANAKDNLKWFIHYILTKRLGHQSVSL